MDWFQQPTDMDVESIDAHEKDNQVGDKKSEEIEVDLGSFGGDDY